MIYNEFEIETSIGLLAADLEYSFKERGEESGRLYLQDYVSSIQIGGVNENPNTNLYFSFLSGNSTSLVILEGAMGLMSLMCLGIPLAML